LAVVFDFTEEFAILAQDISVLLRFVRDFHSFRLCRMLRERFGHCEDDFL